MEDERMRALESEVQRIRKDVRQTQIEIILLSLAVIIGSIARIVEVLR